MSYYKCMFHDILEHAPWIKAWMNQLAHWIKVFPLWWLHVLTKITVFSGTVDFAHRDVPSSSATYSCVAWFWALERVPAEFAIFPYHCHSVVGGSRTLKDKDIDHLIWTKSGFTAETPFIVAMEYRILIRRLFFLQVLPIIYVSMSVQCYFFKTILL